MRIRTKRKPNGVNTQTLFGGRCITTKYSTEAKQSIVRRVLDYLSRPGPEIQTDPSVLWGFARAYDRLVESLEET